MKTLMKLLIALSLLISATGLVMADDSKPAATVAAAEQTTPAATNEVVIRIDNFSFSPAEVTVAPGTTVTWINGDDIPHTVMAVNKAFRSKVMDTEQKYSFVMTTAGSYEYFCSLHPHMKGKVIVK